VCVCLLFSRSTHAKQKIVSSKNNFYIVVPILTFSYHSNITEYHFELNPFFFIFFVNNVYIYQDSRGKIVCFFVCLCKCGCEYFSFCFLFKTKTRVIIKLIFFPIPARNFLLHSCHYVSEFLEACVCVFLICCSWAERKEITRKRTTYL